jgi:hypothetical protein
MPLASAADTLESKLIQMRAEGSENDGQEFNGAANGNLQHRTKKSPGRADYPRGVLDCGADGASLPAGRLVEVQPFAGVIELS